MIEKTAAKYSPGSLLEFDNNPLIECLPEIPKTYNGKVDRKQLINKG